MNEITLEKLRQLSNKQNIERFSSNQRSVQDNSIEQTLSLVVQLTKENFNSLRDLQKEIKTKVGRNQFLSTLGTKLSISQLTSYLSQDILCTKKMEKNPKNAVIQNHDQKNTNLSLQVQELKQKILEMNQNMQTIQNNFSLWEDKIDKTWQLKEEILQTVAASDKNRREKHCQIQQQIFQKADRSQLNKLFKLNNLLTIEKEQLSQRITQLEKNLKDRQTYYDDSEHQLGQQMKKLQFNLKQKQQNLEAIVNQRIQFMEQSVNRTLDLIELREKQIQMVLKNNHINNHQDKIHPILQESIQECRQMIMKTSRILQQNQINFRDLQTRMNIMELKDNQITRALIDVQHFKKKIEHFAQQQKQQTQKIANITQSFDQNVKKILQPQLQEIKRVVVKESQLTTNGIIEQTYKILQNFAGKQQIQQMKRLVYQKQNIMEQLNMKLTDKCILVEKKQDKIEKSLNLISDDSYTKLEKMKQQLNRCLRIQQMRQIIKKLATAQEMQEIAMKIQNKFSSQLQKINQEQHVLNEVLCSENVVGRWLWTQNQIKGGNLVLWDQQIINTLPQNFIWEKGQYYFTIANSGLYKIQLGFYSKKKPNIQLLVNGQTIMSAVNSNSYVIHHSSGRMKNVSQNGQIAGLSLIDFLLLPDKARISVSFSGEIPAQGFFGIQRL